MGHPVSAKVFDYAEPARKNGKDVPIIHVSSPPPSYAHVLDDLESGPSVPLRPLLYAPSPRSFAPRENPLLFSETERPETPSPASQGARRRAKHWKFTLPLGTLVGIGIGAAIAVYFHTHRTQASPVTPPPVAPGTLAGAYTLTGDSALPSSNCGAFASCVVPFTTTLSFTGSGAATQVFAPTTQYTGPVNVSGFGNTYAFVWKDLMVNASGCAQRHIGQVQIEKTPDGTLHGINHDVVQMTEDCAALSAVAGQSCQCDTSVSLTPQVR